MPLFTRRRCMSVFFALFWRDGEVMKIVTFFIWVFEIPPFWSDLGRGLRWWKSWPLLSDCLRFLHSDQIWAEGWGDEIRDLFLSDCLRGSSILIRYGGRVRWWWGNFIWLFEEIPPFWSDLGWGDENRDLFLSDRLRFLHSD